jgi:hypothetical protein
MSLAGPSIARLAIVTTSRQVNTIRAAGLSQGGIAVQRQAGSVVPCDRQQRSCERNLIDFRKDLSPAC